MNGNFTKLLTCGLEQNCLEESQKYELLRIVKAQTTLLIAGLNDDNFSRCSLEIENLITTYGESLHEHLMLFLLSNIHTDLTNSHLKSALLNQHAKFQKKKTQSAITFFKAFRKFCQLNAIESFDLRLFIDSIGFLDSFDIAALSLSLLLDTESSARQQALLTLHESMNKLPYALHAIESFDEDIILYFVDCFTRVINLDIYEPRTDSISLVLTLVESHLSEPVLVGKLQKMISASSLKNQLKELDTLLNKQPMTQPELLRTNRIIEDLISFDPSSSKNVLDTMIKKQTFPSLLDLLSPQISVNIALEATFEKRFDIKSWIEEKAQDASFAEHCFHFLSHMVAFEEALKPTFYRNFPVEIMKSTLKAASCSEVSTNEVVQLQNQILYQYSDFDTIIDGLKTPVTEEETNIYYERLYNNTFPVKKMVDMLKQLKISRSLRDRQLFICMIHTLFDEYPFFSKYPEKELNITSVLFGQLVQQDVLADTILEKALALILESLNIPINTKLVTFGIHALNQFEYRLSELPQFCVKVLQLPYFVKSQPRLTSVIAASQRNKPYELGLGDFVPITCIYLPSLSKSRGCEAVGSIQFSNPDDQMKDRLSAVVDSLVKDNIDIKAAELKVLLDPSYYPWFGRYVVSKAISSPTDFHRDFSMLLEFIGSKPLNIHILYATLSKIMMVLNYTHIPPTESEYSSSKNIGSWLGGLTLANDKPLLDKYMNIKTLMLQGFRTQRQSIVIPMVCKILKQSLNGNVFLIPNPWTMAILRSLTEIYKLTNIESGVKDEIKTLLKDFSVN
ncbi:hypothetical protein BY458DRAFT_475511 [Sporodiniella umbellata]|nr:hypothetical protein BY458DRAFT_475511 [Sporodiniella umbellata]